MTQTGGGLPGGEEPPEEPPPPAWVLFADNAEFVAWHDAKCAALGIPHPGENQLTGETDLAACWTDAYVLPLIDKATGQPIAQVPAEDVTNDGLAEMRHPPVFPDFDNPDAEASTDPPSDIQLSMVQKPLPDTYEVDGVVKDVPRTEDNQPIDAVPVDDILPEP